ncbi:TBC1 domain family member 2A isoform X1 [Ictalurus punctatus]|uniref:TBC1 domain family member 2A isoform X1 n=4 Tax=Ictalurus punctatus TaxID=7998 RepID=A0A2D0SH36_ICTPU|nr:TBC1 domain family member 2A isoform X1 [Ictalurus punctatus]
MEGEGSSKGNSNSADMSQLLPLLAETHKSVAEGERASVVESLEEKHTEIMGLSTGNEGKEGSQVVNSRPESTAVCLRDSELSSKTKLCGYLHKQAGPLKTWKCRWFTYEEKKCQLFYYRTAQDLNPLGKVELRNATFSYPLQGEEGTFHIQTPERTFILKAANRDAKMYWLQQLQLRRWQHREQLCADSPLPMPEKPTQDDQQYLDTCPENFLPMVKIPSGLVGVEAANVPVQTNPLNVSIKHPLIEIQNSVQSFLLRRPSMEMSRSVFWVEPPATLADTPGINPSSSTTTPEISHAQTSPPSSGLDPEVECEKPCEKLLTHGSLTLPNGKLKKTNSATFPFDRKEANTVDLLSRLKQENLTLAVEVQAQKELVWLLHKALEAAQLEKRACAQYLAAESEQERLELVRHSERCTTDLRERLEQLRRENEGLRRSLEERDAHVKELQDNVKMLMEKNQAKQEVIVKLSEQMSACIADPRRTISSDRISSESLRQLVQEMDNLKDDMEAYKTQNKFLNSEIYQLTKLWQNSSEQEKSLMVKCAYLEASNCQMESRYLGVLRKLQENNELNAGQSAVIRKLIEEALQADQKDVIRFDTIREYDEYGFKIIPDYEVEDMKLLAKIQALEIRSHNLLQQETGDRSLLARWTQFLGGRSPDVLSLSEELKTLVRAGIPRQYRSCMWRWMVRLRTNTLRQGHPDLFQQLCEKSRATPHSAARQIQLDLHRTLTTNQSFSSPSSPMLQKLQRVLLAFSWQNPAVGYCQGLNRLAAIALLVLQSEEEAFWCLVAIVQFIMPKDYYTKTLLGSQADQRVFKDFMAEKLPRLVAHLDEYNVDVSLVTFNWFLVVFVESLPSDILLKVWDAFLYEGTKVIFRYALAIFKYKEEDILKIHDNVEIYQYLRFFTKTVTDGRKLTSIAFLDLNPFRMKHVRNRHAVHLQRLKAELRELEKLQKEYSSENSQRKDSILDLDLIPSEDDDDA